MMGDSIDLEVLISPDVAIHLNESKLAENQQITPLENGCSLLTATVRDRGQLRWWFCWGLLIKLKCLVRKACVRSLKLKHKIWLGNIQWMELLRFYKPKKSRLTFVGGFFVS